MLPIAAPALVPNSTSTPSVGDGAAPDLLSVSPGANLFGTDGQPGQAPTDPSIFAQLLVPLAVVAVVEDVALSAEMNVATAAESLGELLPAATPSATPSPSPTASDDAADEELLALLSLLATPPAPVPLAFTDGQLTYGLASSGSLLTTVAVPSPMATSLPGAASVPLQSLPSAPSDQRPLDAQSGTNTVATMPQLPVAPPLGAAVPPAADRVDATSLPAPAAVTIAATSTPLPQQSPAAIQRATPAAVIASAAMTVAPETAADQVGQAAAFKPMAVAVPQPKPRNERLTSTDSPAAVTVAAAVEPSAVLAAQAAVPSALLPSPQPAAIKPPPVAGSAPAPAPLAAQASVDANSQRPAPAAIPGNLSTIPSDEPGHAVPAAPATATVTAPQAATATEEAALVVQSAPRTESQAMARSEAPQATTTRSEPNPLERAVAHQVSRAIVQHLPDGGTRMVMRLTPPELGTVRIEFISRDGMVTARLMAEDEGVRQALDRALPHIRAEVRGDHPSVDISVDRSEQRQAWGEGHARQERRDEQRAGQGRRRRAENEPAFAIDGVEAADGPTALRAAQQLGGRVTRASVDALA